MKEVPEDDIHKAWKATAYSTHSVQNFPQFHLYYLKVGKMLLIFSPNKKSLFQIF